MSVPETFRLHASPEAIRAELNNARRSARLAESGVRALERLLDRREREIANGDWPVLSPVADTQQEQPHE